jgi:hypothetical protein
MKNVLTLFLSSPTVTSADEVPFAFAITIELIFTRLLLNAALTTKVELLVVRTLPVILPVTELMLIKFGAAIYPPNKRFTV